MRQQLYTKAKYDGPKISIDQVIGTHYIRYGELTQMVNSAFVGSTADFVNIYIDLYSIIRPLYKNERYDIEDYSKVTSNIINICAHYREFFRTRYRVESKFYLVYSKNVSHVNNQFYPDYNIKTKYLYNNNRLIDEMVDYNIGLLELLCPYLPNIHFVKSSFETAVVMHDLMCREESNNSNPHIVITKDMYNYQLAMHRENVTIFRPKKYKGEDMSYYINKNNVLNRYIEDRNINIQSIMGGINYPDTLPIVMAMSSIPERSMKSIVTAKTALKLVSEAIMQKRLNPSYNSINLVWDSIDNSRLNISKVSFESRLKAIDIIFQHSVFMCTQECNDMVFKDLYDPDAVREINNKYFIYNPLDLERL
ncbi:MAG: hypothetical protein ACRCXT_11005 [Paraclostridium sp.]